MLNFKKYKHANQYVAIARGCAFFKSYNSLIACVNMKTGNVYLGNDWDYSKTTLRHLNAFLNEFWFSGGHYFTKEVNKLIKSGQVELDQDFLESLVDFADKLENKQ